LGCNVGLHCAKLFPKLDIDRACIPPTRKTQMSDSTTNEPTIKRRRHARGSFHPGVRIKPPQSGNRMPYFRAVFVDPDTAKTVYERLDPDLYPTAEARKQWAIRKSLALRKREAEIHDGARRSTGESFDELTELFIADNQNLRDGTLEEYKRSLRRFSQWADDEGNTDPDRLRRADLFAFRVWAMKLPKKQAARGKKRGQSVDLTKRRKLITVNSDLRVVGTFLRWMIKTERLPKLHLDDLVTGLERYDFIADPPEYLARREIRRSLLSAMRHDQVVFAMTREEKEAGEAGKTPRYVSIAPFLAVAFLAGMRLDELCLIEWRTHVDLEYEDVNGEPIGQIKLRTQDTKTKRARFVSFEISPLLRKLMLALHRKADGKGPVFGVTYDEAQAANQRLRDDFKAPAKLTYQIARSTCSTYLVNAPGIYGSASSFHSAKQLGHSQAVQEKHYAGLLKGIRPEIKTLEGAMHIEAEVRMIIDIVKGKPVELPEEDDDEDA
jgi:hypothetical protein